MPTSATSFSSSSSQCSSPGSPFSARRGALLRADLKARVAAPAASAAGDDRFLADNRQIGEQATAVRLAHQRAGRHGNAQIVAVGAGLVGAAAVNAAIGAKVDLLAKGRERVDALIDIEDDVAAAPAIAAGRSA